MVWEVVWRKSGLLIMRVEAEGLHIISIWMSIYMFCLMFKSCHKTRAFGNPYEDSGRASLTQVWQRMTGAGGDRIQTNRRSVVLNSFKE